MIDLWEIGKSQYFAITKFSNVVLSFDHQVCFLGPVYMEVGNPR